MASMSRIISCTSVCRKTSPQQKRNAQWDTHAEIVICDKTRVPGPYSRIYYLVPTDTVFGLNTNENNGNRTCGEVLHCNGD